MLTTEVGLAFLVNGEVVVYLLEFAGLKFDFGWLFGVLLARRRNILLLLGVVGVVSLGIDLIRIRAPIRCHSLLPPLLC